MTRHVITAKHAPEATPRSFAVSRWVGFAAVALPLVAVLASAWLGLDALVAQRRADQQEILAARADAVAARTQALLRMRLDTLETAAAHNADSLARLDARAAPLEALRDYGVYTPRGQALHDASTNASPDADPPRVSIARAQAIRQAAASGASVLAATTAGSDDAGLILLLAAADHLADPARVAVAETTPTQLLRAASRENDATGSGSSAETSGAAAQQRLALALFDADFQPLAPAAWPAWAANAPRAVEGVSRFDSPHGEAYAAFRRVEGYPLAVGLAQRTPSAWSILIRNAPGLLIGTALCVALVVAGSIMLGSLALRRLAHAEKKRELAFREMEHMQKLSSIGRLAAGVAHEINNPLAIIGEKAGLLKDLASVAKDTPKAERFITLSDSILQAVGRCRAVTHRLLGFARRMEVRTMELDLNEVLRETLGFLEREAMHRGVTLDLSLEADLPPIESDRGQLQQVFLNILNNAMAAVRDGGAIAVATSREEQGVVVAIEDDGVGMSRETLNHIFEPFFSTKGDKGTGLGLSITYGIVNKLGGSIEVASELGEGSRFTIHLPLRAPGVGVAGATEIAHG